MRSFGIGISGERRFRTCMHDHIIREYPVTTKTAVEGAHSAVWTRAPLIAAPHRQRAESKFPRAHQVVSENEIREYLGGRIDG